MTSTGAVSLVAVDIGNSRIKLGEFQHPASIPLPLPSRSVGVALDWTDPDIRPFLLPNPLACRWSIASVNCPATARLMEWLTAQGVQDVQVVMHGDMPLSIEVARPDLVGMDRLANAVAANRLRVASHAAIVISMGSAITVDLVSAAGAFSGGAIMPGMAMAARALDEFTDLLPLVDVQTASALGKSTAEAIRAGVYWGAVGAVRELVSRLAERHAPVEILLTGGAPDFAVVLSKEEDPPLKVRAAFDLLGIAIAALHTAPHRSMTATAIGTTRVVMLTAAGRGAVASLLVEGPRALAAVDALFHPATVRPLAVRPCDRIVFGRWQSSEYGEEVVVRRRDDRQIEIHCHGGQAAALAIIASLIESGCQEVSWQDWARWSHADSIASAARIALAAAPTERTATILWDQYTGALTRALRSVEKLLGSGDAAAALACVDDLLRWSSLGRHLVRPWQVVFAGAPNVGKSSLTNALLGYQRAIVHDLPGTTRDVVAAVSALAGWPVELADTAGQRASDEPLEAAGIRLAQDRSAEADLVVLVFDASNPDPNRERTLSESWPRALRVFNKCDLLPPGSSPAEGAGTGLYASALLGTGIEALGHEIANRLVQTSPVPGQAVPFTSEQVDLLKQFRSAVLAG